jgi:hypothetical protein
MKPSQQDLAPTYRNLTDDDLASLSSDSASLTDGARSALAAEVQRRGLDDAQLIKLHSVELRHESQFDRLEKFRRRRLARRGLGLYDLSGWIFAVLGALVFILISELIRRHH